MKTKIELNGLYRVYSGKDVDGIEYWAYMIIDGKHVYKTGETANDRYYGDEPLRYVEIKEDEDPIEKLGIFKYTKII